MGTPVMAAFCCCGALLARLAGGRERWPGMAGRTTRCCRSCIGRWSRRPSRSWPGCRSSTRRRCARPVARRARRCARPRTVRSRSRGPACPRAPACTAGACPRPASPCRRSCAAPPRTRPARAGRRQRGEHSPAPAAPPAVLLGIPPLARAAVNAVGSRRLHLRRLGDPPIEATQAASPAPSNDLCQLIAIARFLRSEAEAARRAQGVDHAGAPEYREKPAEEATSSRKRSRTPHASQGRPARAGTPLQSGRLPYMLNSHIFRSVSFLHSKGRRI